MRIFNSLASLTSIDGQDNDFIRSNSFSSKYPKLGII
jgi:hypothetical protein